MPEIVYRERAHAAAPAESVLDTLLRHGVEAPHNCKAGSCGSCMMKAVTGTIPARAQAGLKDAWKSNGYFLPCVCLPETDMTVAPVGADAQVTATIASLQPLSDNVLQVHVTCDSPIGHRAGQYVTLLRKDASLARSYSIANLPDESHLEFHVRRIPGGRMSGWLHDEAQPGDRLSVLGPSGDCFYVPGNPEQPILLAGTGTGLAPLYGILRDAIRNRHSGPIHLFHGAVTRQGLYLVDALRTLAAEHPDVTYTPTVLHAGEAIPAEFVSGAIDQTVLSRLPKLKGWRAYVCGDPALVQLLKKKFFLAGAASRDIYSDAFLPSG